MRAGLVLLLALAGWMGGAPVARGQEYVIGSEDVLSLTVWEHQELSRTVAVRADGSITVPPVGDIPAAGKATSALAREIESRFYNVLRLTTQVTISVVAFNSQKLFLAGQVNTPGRYSFEVLPNLVDFLGMAGGLGPTADLSRVRVLRNGGQEPNKTLTVDLTRAMTDGDMSGVPPLQTGDVVFVPGGSAGGQTGPDVIYVLGEVARPGPYNAMPGMNLPRLLSVAGGVTPMGDMSRIEVLSAAGKEGGFRVQVDLRREMEAGRTGLTLRSGDTVLIPARGSGGGTRAWGVMRETLGVSRDILNLFLIRNVLN